MLRVCNNVIQKGFQIGMIEKSRKKGMAMSDSKMRDIRKRTILHCMRKKELCICCLTL